MEKFLDLLAAHQIEVIADVRSHPYSRYNTEFNREYLQAELRAAGIDYVFLGRELGARSEDASCYINGKAKYDLLAQTPLFRKGIERITKGIRNHRVALMCAEKDPLTCHRAILVCRRLEIDGISTKHILENGLLETHEDSIARLRKELGLPEKDLFRTTDEIIEEAYELRGREIAYSQDRSMEDGEAGGWA